MRGLGWCLRTQGVVVVCLAVNQPHSDFLCCLWAQCPSATCGFPPSLCYSVGTLLCWWISTFCPWAAKRMPAGLLRTTSRYRHREKGVGVNKCVSEYKASVLQGAFSKDSSSVESKMTLSLLSILWRGLHCCKTILISPPGHWWSCLTGLSHKTPTILLLVGVLHPNLCYLSSSKHVVIKKYLHAVCRRLQPWFKMLWTRGLSSTKSPGTTEDNPNRRRNWHLPQPFLLKVTASCDLHCTALKLNSLVSTLI